MSVLKVVHDRKKSHNSQAYLKFFKQNYYTSKTNEDFRCFNG